MDILKDMNVLVIGGLVLMGWGGVMFLILKSSSKEEVSKQNFYKWIGIVSLVLGGLLFLAGLFN